MTVRLYFNVTNESLVVKGHDDGVRSKSIVVGFIDKEVQLNIAVDSMISEEHDQLIGGFQCYNTWLI